MESAVSPQPDGPHIRINHQIHREIIRRKFTQRQRNIIDFILTLSWGCGKTSAIIPKLKDFALCGVKYNHIRKELQTLVMKNVIFWEGSMNVFQINKHYDQWDIDVNEDFDPKLLNNLISFNIENESPNLSKKLPKKGSSFPNREGEKLPERGTNFPKREAKTSRIGKRKLPKKGSLMRHFFNPSAAFRTSKTIIKAIIKKRTTTTTTTEIAPEEYPFSRIFQAYQNNFTKNGEIREFEAQELGVLFDDYGGEWMIKAMRETFRQSEDKRNLAYVQGVLIGYRKRGGPESPKSKDPPEQREVPQRRTKQQSELEDLRRKAREERQRGQS
ncbi:replication protein [Paenibacillus mesophilus]|uniref:replication protein n=1 Tax=Paenibacillus mesophilus TaxID=2582849 RepID=UPI00110E0D96|nr:replication protein [Paenibacillus mesophilus]TMV49389.1 replication protein [Paenibacillus mesophilus]